jgi:hypothetical protein
MGNGGCTRSEKWILGTILEVLAERTYLVEGRNGGIYRRNRVQMRPTRVEIDRPPIMPLDRTPLLQNNTAA